MLIETAELPFDATSPAPASPSAPLAQPGNVGNVVEFGPVALSRLEAARDREGAAREEIETLAQANFVAQTQTHAAVLELLAARNNADLAARVDACARDLFGLAGGTLCLEGFNAPAGWRGLRQGMVSLLLMDAPARLGLAVAKEELFGPLSATVKSMALVELRLFEPLRPGLLAFGSADADAFTPDMGAELIAFVARVVERTAERWPPQ